jgi:GTP cyclohydrolase II
MPLAQGTFDAVGYRSLIDDSEHLALVMGDLGDGRDVLVRVHSECLTGDVFGSRRCDCGTQLQASLAAVGREGRGVVLYMRGHEGRGVGLLQKLRAYTLQDDGADTVDANVRLGLPADARDYGTGAQILVDLGVRTMRLLTNNPTKRAGLEGYGLEIVGRVPLGVDSNQHNLRYLRAKRDRMGHDLPGLPWYDDDVSWMAMTSMASQGSMASWPGRQRSGNPDLHRAMFGLEPGALTADEGAELQARIRNLAGLSRVVIDAEPAARDGDSAARPTGPPPASVFDLISATLPDPSLFGFWDVVETVVVAVATAIGEALVPGIGGPVAGGLAALAWHEWVDPALMTA